MGLRLHNAIMPAAFLGSMAAASRYILQCQTARQKQHCIAAPMMLRGIDHAMRQVIDIQQAHFEKLLGTVLPPREQIGNPVGCLEFWANKAQPIKKAQHKINANTHEAAHAWLTNNLPATERVRLLSASGRAAGCSGGRCADQCGLDHRGQRRPLCRADRQWRAEQPHHLKALELRSRFPRT